MLLVQLLEPKEYRLSEIIYEQNLSSDGSIFIEGGQNFDISTSLVIDGFVPFSLVETSQKFKVQEMTIKNLDVVTFDENLEMAENPRNISLEGINKVIFKTGLLNKITVFFNQIQEIRFEDAANTHGSIVFGSNVSSEASSADPKSVLKTVLNILLHTCIGTFLVLINLVAIFYIFIFNSAKTCDGLSFKFWKRFRFLKLKQPIRRKGKSDKKKKNKEKLAKLD